MIILYFRCVCTLNFPNNFIEGYILTRHVIIRLLRLPAGRSYPVSAAVASQAPMFKLRTETQHIAEGEYWGASSPGKQVTLPKVKLQCDHYNVRKKYFPSPKLRIMKTSEKWRRVHQCSRDVKPGQASWQAEWAAENETQSLRSGPRKVICSVYTRPSLTEGWRCRFA